MAENTVSGGLFWKLLERFGVSGIQFVLQIILARLLDPDHYGVLSLMVIFTTLANTFIQTGFSTSLIQNRETDDDDFSSVFWVTLCVSVGLYGVLYFAIPYIAGFYEMPGIVTPFRVLALMLIPGGINSVQLAKVSRELDFRKVFVSNIGAIAVSGAVGIAVAYMGGGIWALVLQTLTNVTLACVIMFFTVRLRPRFVCNFARVRVLFSYGWKLLVSSLLETLYQDLSSLVIGKKYTKDTLGFYNRGKQFPQFIINAITGAVQSVMLPAMSALQDEKLKVKALMRRSITISAYVIFPMSVGLAAVAPSVVKLLLTDKWMACVPYLQIFCISFASYPVHTCNLQAINAMGRSDLYLILEVIKKIIGVGVLAVAVFCFDSPIAIATSGVVSMLLSFFVNAYPNKRLIDYSIPEQIRDLVPQLILSAVMFACIYGFNYLKIHAAAVLAIQIIAGVAVYVVGSVLFKLESLRYLMGLIKMKVS